MTITGISSMATRSLLADLIPLFEARSGKTVAIESVGGVEAAKRVQAGEAFDVAVLASNAIGQLIAAGCIIAGSKVDLARSGVAIAVHPARCVRRSTRNRRSKVRCRPRRASGTPPGRAVLIWRSS